MRVLAAIVFITTLIGIYIWAYIANHKTPVPPGCEDLKADSDGCKITSCSLHPQSKKG